jgi:hypothetical protein
MPVAAVNPFTRAILKHITDPVLGEFVVHWDALEFLVIRVFRAKAASQPDQAEYRHLRSRLSRDYPRWQEALRPYWQEARVAGQAASQDPFRFLLSESDPGWFVGNWSAMQHLPAAREALNQFLIDQVESEI